MDHPQNVSKQRWNRGIIKFPLYDPLSDRIQCITRKYFSESPLHTTNNPTLVEAITSIKQKFMEEETRALAMVPKPVPSISLPLPAVIVPQPYLGQGNCLPYREPPISIMGCLPQPVGTMWAPIAQWYDVCPLDNQRFKHLIAHAKETPPSECM